VEKVEYWDENHVLCETNNTPTDPHDLSAWASLPDTPSMTDGAGQCIVLLTVSNRSEIAMVRVVAYDWSIWKAPAPVQVLGQ
jgi:hypothetical protein